MSANDRALATSDEEAIGQVLDGNTEAFAILVRHHSARVKRLGMSFFEMRKKPPISLRTSSSRLIPPLLL